MPSAAAKVHVCSCIVAMLLLLPAWLLLLPACAEWAEMSMQTQHIWWWPEEKSKQPLTMEADNRWQDKYALTAAKAGNRYGACTERATADEHLKKKARATAGKIKRATAVISDEHLKHLKDTEHWWTYKNCGDEHLKFISGQLLKIWAVDHYQACERWWDLKKTYKNAAKLVIY